MFPQYSPHSESPVNMKNNPHRLLFLSSYYPISPQVAHQDLSLLITQSLHPTQLCTTLLSLSRTTSLLRLILINEDNPNLLNSIKGLLAKSIFNQFFISDNIPRTTFPQITRPHYLKLTAPCPPAPHNHLRFSVALTVNLEAQNLKLSLKCLQIL